MSPSTRPESITSIYDSEPRYTACSRTACNNHTHNADSPTDVFTINRNHINHIDRHEPEGGSVPSPLLYLATAPGSTPGQRLPAISCALRHGVYHHDFEDETAVQELHADLDRVSHYALRLVAALQLSLNHINDTLKPADFETCTARITQKYTDMLLAPSTQLIRVLGFTADDTEAATATDLLNRVARQFAIQTTTVSRFQVAQQVHGALERLGVTRPLSVLMHLHTTVGSPPGQAIVEFDADDIIGFAEPHLGNHGSTSSDTRRPYHYDTPELRHNFTGAYTCPKTSYTGSHPQIFEPVTPKRLVEKYPGSVSSSKAHPALSELNAASHPAPQVFIPRGGAAGRERRGTSGIGSPVPITISSANLDYDPRRDVTRTHEAPSLTAPATRDNLLKVDLPPPPPFNPERVPPVLEENMTSESLKAELIATYRTAVFLPEDKNNPMPAIPGVEFDITYDGDLDRIRAKPFRTTPKKLESLRYHIRYLTQRGVIRPSNSYVASRAFIKSEQGKEHGRMCIDFVRLNEGSKTQLWPIPNMQGLFDQLASSTYVSVIDGKDAYYGVTLSEKAIPFTSFVTPDGQWEYTRGCFGLASLPSAFSRIVSQILNGCNSFAVAYLDDVIVFSRSLSEHRQHLHAVFQRFEAYNFLASAKKMQIIKSEVEILGHIWTKYGLKVNPDKLKVLQEWPSPTSPSEVRSFLGFAGWLRSFIPKFAEIAQPLQDKSCLEKEDFTWTEEDELAMRKLITEINRPGVILAHFHPDWKTRLTTDGSMIAVGATLEQQDPVTEVWHPLEFMSKALSKRRRDSKPTPYWVEMYGLISALRKWHHYLMSVSNPFEVFTDHAAITFLTSSLATNENRSLLRWKTEILTYHCVIKHIPGVDNDASDALSRIAYTVYEEASAESDDHDLLPRATFAAVHALSLRHDQLADERIVDDTGLRTASIVISAIKAARTSEFTNAVNSLLIEEDFDAPPTTEGFASIHPEGQSIAILQRSCLQLKPLISWLETSSDKDRKANFSAEEQDYLSTISNDYFIHRQHRALYHKAIDAKGQMIYQLVVPEALRINYLLRIHNEQTGGHFGGYSMFHRLSRHFWWETMLRDCRHHANQCTSCRRVKSKRSSEYYLVEERMSTATVWDVISLDFVGPLPPTDEGYTYILAVLDNFSLYTMFFPMKTATAEAVSEVLYNLIMTYGAMRKILTDRGSNLNLSKVLQALTSVLNIKQTMTASYNPEGNSQNERSHRWLKSIMRIFVNIHDKKWSDTLSPMAFAYNTTPRTDIKLSPFYVFHGRDPVMVEDLAAMPAIMHMPDSQSVITKTRARVRQVTQAREILHLALREARRTTRVTRRLKPVPFKAGDTVLLRNLKPVNTLSIPFYGPYTVIEKTSPVRFTIKHITTQRIRERVHAKHLRSMKHYLATPRKPLSVFGDPPSPAPTPVPPPAPELPPQEPVIPPQEQVLPPQEPVLPPQEPVLPVTPSPPPERTPKLQKLLESVHPADMVVYRSGKTAGVGQVLRRVDEEQGFSVHDWSHNGAASFSLVKWMPLWHTERGPQRSMQPPTIGNLRSTGTDFHTNPSPVTRIIAFDNILAKFNVKDMKHHRLPGPSLGELRKTRLKLA